MSFPRMTPKKLIRTMNPAPVLFIVYQSQTGNTEQLAIAVEHGAREISGVEVQKVRAVQGNFWIALYNVEFW